MFSMNAAVQHSQPSSLRFEGFELDLKTFELRKEGKRVRLQNQPAKLLAMLALRKGELVTREEIQRALWKDDEFVEFEHGINTAISRIRDALEDNREQPRMVETLPRLGYRFLADVEKVFPTNSKAVDVLQPPAPVPSNPNIELTTPLNGNIATANDSAAPEPKEFFALPLPKGLARGLFLFIQFGYLAMYLGAMLELNALERIVAGAGYPPSWLTAPLIMIMCAIAVRIYLISAVGWGHPDAGRKFHQLFPALLVLDAIWAASPLLVTDLLTRGIALAGVAGLAYLPFAQRTLVRTLYPRL
jgi:DNA-binding winged helix-turn-helix (wHTH) protein